MRIARLTSAVAAGITVLALAPTGALAAKHPSPNGRCRININIAPPTITAGDPVVIFGRLSCPRHAGQVVRLYHRLAGQARFTPIQSTRTDVNGFYEFTRADGVVTTNRAWHVIARGAQSGNKAVRVAAQVTLNGPPSGSNVLTGPAHAVTFTGTVNPADVGARVILQRQNATGGDDWGRIDQGVVSSGGTFSITHTFVVPGDANIRVLIRSNGRNIPSPSNLFEYQISQAQNPNLTINASADPLSFGQTVTITGTLAGGANQPVTLLGRGDGPGQFQPIAQVTTDASGNYAFPAQMPINNVVYVVQGAGRSSAQLYEGVHDVLSAAASASTVAAGQSVTFAGLVAPDKTGHVIYLERQNASGQDFHVVQVASVGAGSSYSITHQVYEPGTKVFRVHIPGGPENEGAASQTFTINVTPSPIASLTPAAPTSSTLPSPGQQ